MTVLYVREQGAVVRRDTEQIRVTQRKESQRRDLLLSQISVRDLEQVVLCGNVQLTTQAAALLLQHEVDIVFLSMYGTFRGRLSRDGSKFARLRHAQLALSGNDARSLAVARSIVQAKLANQRNLINRLAERAAKEVGAAAADGLDRAAQGIDHMRKECVRASTPDALRGFEGKAGVHYFGALRLLLDPRWQFKGRAYHPPPDPFNALLSFGYSLLLKDMTATINLVGLDPYLGCFHALEYGRPSLTLDLMEEFRPLVVDAPMMGLVLDGKLTPDHFTVTGRAERPIELGPAQMPNVIQSYEKRLDDVLMHSPSSTNQRLRRCYEMQARIYARVVMQQRSDYEGMVA